MMAGRWTAMIYRLATWLCVTLLAGLWSAPPVAAAEKSSERTIELHVQAPAFQVDGMGVTIEGYALNDVPGAPVLPVRHHLVELPASGRWNLSYQSTDSVMSAVSTRIPAVPVPQLSLDQPTSWMGGDQHPLAVSLVDQPDPAVYQRSAFYPPEPVVAGPEQIQRGRRYVPIHVYPVQYNPVTDIVRYHPDLRITIRVQEEELPLPKLEQPADQTPLEVAGALRLYTGQPGLYRLTYAELQDAGVDLTIVDPRTFSLSYLGQPVDILVNGGADGRFDPGDLVIFYAEPYVGRYMNHNVYRFTYGDAQSSSRIPSRAVTPIGDEPLIPAMTQTFRVEVDREYRSNYQLPPDFDPWFDHSLFVHVAMPTSTVSYDLDRGNPIRAIEGDAELRVLLHGGSARQFNPDQSIRIWLNDHEVGIFQWDGQTLHMVSATVPTGWLDSSPNRVTLEAGLDQLPALHDYWISPDWVELDFMKVAEAIDDRLTMTGIPMSGPNAQLRVKGFQQENILVMDVTDPRHPVQLSTTQVSSGAGSFTLDFWDHRPEDAGDPTYALSTREALLSPEDIQQDLPSKWRSPIHTADYIAIVHTRFWDAIQPLLDHRVAEGLRVKKVNVEDIYDEFSDGRVDPEAIRSFLTYAYDNWNQDGAPPRYVLLVGDGHYDFKDAADTGLPNLIPPYLVHVDPWLGETAADNRYVCVDGPDDYLADMYIGRIPAQEPDDVTAVVDKILAYETSSPPGDWRRRAVFVADAANDPLWDFHALSDQVRLNWLPSTFLDEPLYYGSDGLTSGVAMRLAISDALNEGAAYLQWFGHASQFRWGSTSIFDVNHIGGLNQNGKWPFITHYGSWSGYFLGIASSPLYNGSERSLAEVLLMTPNRGSVADLAPTGLHIGTALLNLNKGVVQAMFQNQFSRVGDVVAVGKLYHFGNSTSWHDLIDTSTLFADPALKLQVPQFERQKIFLPAVVN